MIDQEQKILLIEDNQVDATLIRELLDDADSLFRVQIANSLEAGKKRLDGDTVREANSDDVGENRKISQIHEKCNKSGKLLLPMGTREKIRGVC